MLKNDFTVCFTRYLLKPKPLRANPILQDHFLPTFDVKATLNQFHDHTEEGELPLAYCESSLGLAGIAPVRFSKPLETGPKMAEKHSRVRAENTGWLAVPPIPTHFKHIGLLQIISLSQFPWKIPSML
jgi:hypothetical protein